MSEMTEDAKKIIAAVEEMVGGSWELSREQALDVTQPLRHGTADEIIAAMPQQIESMRAKAAKAIEGWEPGEVQPLTIARTLMLSAPSTKGQGGNDPDLIFNMLDRKAIFQEGADHAVRQLGLHNPRIASITARWWLVFRRMADAAGVGFYLNTGLSPKEIEADMRRNKAKGAT